MIFMMQAAEQEMEQYLRKMGVPSSGHERYALAQSVCHCFAHVAFQIPNSTPFPVSNCWLRNSQHACMTVTNTAWLQLQSYQQYKRFKLEHALPEVSVHFIIVVLHSAPILSLNISSCCYGRQATAQASLPSAAQAQLLTNSSAITVVSLNEAAKLSTAANTNPRDSLSEDWVVCSSSSSTRGQDTGVKVEGQMPLFVVLDDTWRGTSDLAELFGAMQRPCFGLLLPEVC